MLEKFIPSFESEMTWLSSVGISGYTLGFRYNMERPPLLRNTYSNRWQDRYNSRAYLFKDPVVVWFNDHSGSVRWSGLPYADSFGVLADAKRYGLTYGGIFSIHVGNERNWLTLARSDRELTDTEMAALAAKFESWTNAIYANKVDLSPAEMAAFKLLSQGLDRAAVAAELGVSVSTVKLRQTSILNKLKATNMKEAIRMASSLNLFV